MSEHLATLLSAAIGGTRIAEVRKVEHSSKKVRLVMRIQNNRVKSWLFIVDYVMARQAEAWAVHFCKHYFRRGTSLIYAWEMVVGPTSEYVDVFDQSVAEIADLVTKGARVIPKSMGYQIMEVPLIGVTKNRNKPKQPFNPAKGGVGQKGAYTTGKTNV